MDNLQPNLHQSLQPYRNYFLVEGILLAFFGVLSLMLPGVSSLAFTLLLGFLMIIGGIIQAVRSFKTRELPGFWPSLFSGILFIVVGVLIVESPLLGMMSLTALLAAFFMFEGLFRIVMGIQFRKHAQWLWLILSGVLSLVLAIIVIQNWLVSSLWLVGTLLGVYLLFFGISFILLSVETTHMTRV